MTVTSTTTFEHRGAAAMSRARDIRRGLVAIATVLAMLVMSSAAVTAAQAASPQASCVGVITSYEASQLAPGSVGAEVSGLARSDLGLGSAVVSPLAHTHGSIADCAQDEG
jgi:uncharacterized membrane protein